MVVVVVVVVEVVNDGVRTGREGRGVRVMNGWM